MPAEQGLGLGIDRGLVMAQGHGGLAGRDDLATQWQHVGLCDCGGKAGRALVVPEEEPGRHVSQGGDLAAAEPVQPAFSLKNRVAFDNAHPPAVIAGEKRIDTGLVAAQLVATVERGAGEDERVPASEQAAIIHGVLRRTDRDAGAPPCSQA